MPESNQIMLKRRYRGLRAIGYKRGTDKYKHGYLPFYEHHFAPRRPEPLRLLEIGIQGGASLRMWKEFFPNGAITGCDINKDAFFAERRIECCYLDQSSRTALTEFRETHKEGFDIIIDDGSHKMRDQQISLALLFPMLKSGGFYAIEDLHTSIQTGTQRNGSDWELKADLSNSTVRVLEGFVAPSKRFAESLSPITSPYLKKTETEYLNGWISYCEVFYVRRRYAKHKPQGRWSWSVTSMIQKR